jgi:hypothetical protein
LQSTVTASRGAGVSPEPLEDEANPARRGRAIFIQLRLQEVAAPPVDLLDLRAADAFLALEVIRGERIYCRDEPLADEFELFVMRRAGDLEPFELERRRLLAMTAFTRASSGS